LHVRVDAKCAYNWSENLKGRDHLEDLSIDAQIILKRILKTMCGCGLGSSDLAYKPGMGSCGQTNEHSYSVKDGQRAAYLSDY
jgi:hypothetical protein